MKLINLFASLLACFLPPPTNHAGKQTQKINIEQGKIKRDLNTCVEMILSPKNKPMLFPNDWFLNDPKEHVSTYFLDYVLVAREKNQTIGMITFDASQKKDQTASINLLVVDEQYHRRGIGTLLMQNALAAIKNERTILTVYKYNHAARNLYKKLGFTDETNGGIQIDDNDPLLILEHWQEGATPVITRKKVQHEIHFDRL
ncbi:MAG: hypothetical protein UV79_C0010G0004 [candidate division TM6 bacterium GW2011_GWF2_43_17]|nr:MAG: hypothetical protein UV79_C0010G0004 [candidate division TM6 bacterium GW2011_GWF2_43_17]HAU30439.1 hypothetical protein [Candidatus Dependentiae bacterium]